MKIRILETEDYNAYKMEYVKYYSLAFQKRMFFIFPYWSLPEELKEYNYSTKNKFRDLETAEEYANNIMKIYLCTTKITVVKELS
jgi:hypothetical protein